MEKYILIKFEEDSVLTEIHNCDIAEVAISINVLIKKISSLASIKEDTVFEIVKEAQGAFNECTRED